jgi:hypothetical protein
MRNLIAAAMLGLALTFSVGHAGASPSPENGEDILCVEQLGDEKWLISQWAENGDPCRFSIPPYGVMVRLDYGEMEISPSEGVFTYGLARVYTAGMPFRVIGDQVHTISSNDIVDVEVGDGLTIILSKEGESSVVSCGESPDPDCVRRGFYLLEGHLLALKSNGALYAWEDESGKSIDPTNRGCNAAAKGGARVKLLFIILTVLWLLRRRKKRLV